MKTKMYRLRVGDKYCSLNTNFHVDGVAIPDAKSRQTAHVVELLDYMIAINRAEQDGFPHLAAALVQLFRSAFPELGRK